MGGARVVAAEGNGTRDWSSMMPRPILDERITIRLPHELLADALDHIARNNSTINRFVVNCIENELSRFATYRIDYYRDLRPLLDSLQGVNARPCGALSDRHEKDGVSCQTSHK